LTLTAKKPSKIPQDPKTLGDHIKKRRLELGLHQAQVGEILGVTECTITNWEKNRTNPTLRTLPNIIEFLGYDPSASDQNTIGGRLLQYRKGRGITQKELAKQIGIDPTTLSRLERNRGECLQSVLEMVRTFLEHAA